MPSAVCQNWSLGQSYDSKIIVIYLCSSFRLLGVESRAEKEKIACKAVHIHKMTTIFTQNDNLWPFSVKIVVIFLFYSSLQAVLSSSAWEKSRDSTPKSHSTCRAPYPLHFWHCHRYLFSQLFVNTCVQGLLHGNQMFFDRLSKMQYLLYSLRDKKKCSFSDSWKYKNQMNNLWAWFDFKAIYKCTLLYIEITLFS